MDIEKIREIIKNLTLEEKAFMAGSSKGLRTNAVKNMVGIKVPVREYFPLSALGCTFDVALAAEYGKIVASEAASCGAAYARINCGIAREPMKEGSEQFFGEDAFAASEMAKAFVAVDYPIMADGILGGENEFCERYIDERALMELYLYPFLQVSNKCGAVEVPAGAINGELCAESKPFLKILEDNTASDTLIVNAVGCAAPQGFTSGVTVVGGEADNKNLYELMRGGKIDERAIDKKLERILAAMQKAASVKTAKVTAEAIDNFMYKLSLESVVLLKNEGMFPLAQKKEVSILGDISKEQAALLAADLTVLYNKTACDTRIIFLRLVGEKYTSEQADIVKKAKDKSAKVAVVLLSARPAPLPFIDSCDSVFYAPYYSDKTIEALRKMFVGKINPSGKLSFTYANSYAEYPARANAFVAKRGMFCYESLLNGYRYFDSYSKDVLFPFGHGLSYSKLQINSVKFSCDKNNLIADFTVKNVGEASAGATVFIFGSILDDNVFGLQSRLVAFERVFLKKGETKHAHKVVNLNAFSVFDEKNNEWKIMGGKYDISIRLSSRDVRFSEVVKVPGVKRLALGLSKKHIPTYYAKNAFSPLGVDIEKVMKVPLIAPESDYAKYLKMPSGDRLIRAFAKRLSKAGEMTHMQATALASRLSSSALKKILDDDKD